MICATADFHINYNNRIDDTIKSLNQIAKIVNEECELLIILGDVYHTRRPRALEMNVFRDFINSIKVPVELLVGNHDKDLGDTTLDEFYKFKRDNVRLHKAPYLLEYKELKFYLHHILVNGAKLGPSDIILNPKNTLPLSELKKVKADFYLLGDVHKPQVINNSPPILYTGSIERENFGERNEDKFVVLIDPKTKKFGYKKLLIRPMHQLDLDLNIGNGELIKVPSQVEGAIIKVKIKGTKEQIEKYNEAKLRDSLTKSLTYSISYDIIKETKKRNENINESKSIKEIFIEYASQVGLDENTIVKGKEIINGY